MNHKPIDSLLLLGVTLVLLLLAAYGGKYVFKRRYEHAAVEDDEAKLVLGALLSFLMLLVGLVLTIAIGGYTDRLSSEENESIAVGVAMQHTQLLSAAPQQQANELLRDYLDARIEFFNSGVGPDNHHWWQQSLQLQGQLWSLAVLQAQAQPNSIHSKVLESYSQLYETLQRTKANWRHHIPVVGWWVLLACAFFANGLIGYNIRGIKGENWLIIFLPLLTTAAFYIIAEIDLPGEGLIRVLPDGLSSLQLAPDFLPKS